MMIGFIFLMASGVALAALAQITLESVSEAEGGRP